MDVEFYHSNRRYTCSISQHNSLDMLLIENSEGAVLGIVVGQKTGYKRSKTGDNEEIDLSHPYLQELIKTAQSAIEAKKQIEQRKQQEEINQQEKSFFDKADALFEEESEDLLQTLNIAVVGKVSSGKSSLINALLQRNRSNMVAKVGAEAGITTAIKVLRLNEKVSLIDSPGLDDIRAENSKITQEFLKQIDVGILIVTGASDASQKKHLDDLKAHCDSVFVVLNKIDEWDKLNPSALEKVINQWQETLRIEKIYPCCANGYDPETRSNVQPDIRGINLLREDIENFLDLRRKKLLLACQMAQKRTYAQRIIAGAVVAVAGQALLPGKAAYITATQATAIASLYYLYTGEILSKGTAFSMLPIFAGQSVATSVFLFVTSFIPPTGIIEVAAAVTAASITIAMLASVNFVLESGANLEEKELLKSKFRNYQKQAETMLKGFKLSDINNLRKLNFNEIVKEFL